MDEAFCLSVGAWSVGPGKPVLDVLLVEELAEIAFAVAASVVGEHAAHGEAEAGEVGAGHVEEELRRAAGLVRQNSGKADAAVIVDGDVQVLVTGAARFAGAVAVDAMAGLDDTGQALDIEVDQIAWMFVLVAHHRRRRIQRAQPVEPGPAQDAADSGTAQSQRQADAQAVIAQPAQRDDLFR